LEIKAREFNAAAEDGEKSLSLARRFVLRRRQHVQKDFLTSGVISTEKNPWPN
jgi:hypothetical protein